MILLTNWCYKNDRARTVLYTTTLLFTKNYQNWLINVEDIASESRHCIQHDQKEPIYGVHVSPGSAETLVRRGGITYHHSIAYLLSNNSAKNYQTLLMQTEVSVQRQCRFLTDTVCYRPRRKNVRISTDILWRVFHVLTEPVPYTFVSVNQRTNEAQLHYSVNLRIQTYTEPVPLKYGKLAIKYPWIYGCFFTVYCNLKMRMYMVFQCLRKLQHFS